MGKKDIHLTEHLEELRQLPWSAPASQIAMSDRRLQESHQPILRLTMDLINMAGRMSLDIRNQQIMNTVSTMGRHGSK